MISPGIWFPSLAFIIINTKNSYWKKVICDFKGQQCVPNQMKQKFKFKSGSPRKLIEECSQGQHLWGVKETGSEGEVELRGNYNRSLSSGEIWTWVGLLQVCSLETRELGAYSTEVASCARWVCGRSQNYIPALWSSSCIQVCAAGWWNLLKLGRRRSEDRFFSWVSGEVIHSLLVVYKGTGCDQRAKTTFSVYLTDDHTGIDCKFLKGKLPTSWENSHP